MFISHFKYSNKPENTSQQQHTSQRLEWVSEWDGTQEMRSQWLWIEPLKINWSTSLQTEKPSIALHQVVYNFEWPKTCWNYITFNWSRALYSKAVLENNKMFFLNNKTFYTVVVDTKSLLACWLVHSPRCASHRPSDAHTDTLSSHSQRDMERNRERQRENGGSRWEKPRTWSAPSPP